MAIICEKVVGEGGKTISIAYSALHRFSDFTSMRDKIYSFTQQSIAKFPCFSAAGFFKVDLSMLFIFVNLTTTYVIVIVQFSGNRS